MPYTYRFIHCKKTMTGQECHKHIRREHGIVCEQATRLHFTRFQVDKIYPYKHKRIFYKSDYSSTLEAPYKCKFCGVFYMSPNDLLNHCNEKHEAELIEQVKRRNNKSKRKPNGAVFFTKEPLQCP